MIKAKLNNEYYVAELETIWLFAIKWIKLNKIISISNTWIFYKGLLLITKRIISVK